MTLIAKLWCLWLYLLTLRQWYCFCSHRRRFVCVKLHLMDKQTNTTYKRTQQTCLDKSISGALIVTSAVLLRVINCRFIIIISSSSNIQTCHRLVCNISLNNQTCPFAYLSVRWNLTLSKRGGPFPSPLNFPFPSSKTSWGVSSPSAYRWSPGCKRTSCILTPENRVWMPIVTDLLRHLIKCHITNLSLR